MVGCQVLSRPSAAEPPKAGAAGQPLQDLPPSHTRPPRSAAGNSSAGCLKTGPQYIATHRPWAVMHFAAYAYVGESTAEPAKYYNNNIGGSAKLLQACAAFDCRNFVFSSSCATYGIPERLPITETTPQAPVNPYGYTKLVVEHLLKDAEAAYGIRHVALRYFNAALIRTQRPI